MICPICEAPVDAGDSPATPPEPPTPVEEAVVDGWRLGNRLRSTSAVRERFTAVRTDDDRRAVLTLYAEGSEPDPAVYDVLRKLPRDHVPEVIATGRWCDRAYEVTEELTGGNLANIIVAREDLETFRQITDQLGRALHAFSESGLRHRDLRPGVVLVRSREPLDLAITGFGSARLSEFDLDIVSPLETTRYMAPEAIAGGVAAASDWWSLGILLLEAVTRGACFEGINEQAFLIHVLTNGISIPTDIDPSVNLLLRGLLARDRRERWQWKEVYSWLAGEPVSAPAPSTPADEVTTGASISLAGKQYRSPTAFAVAAAEATNWDEAQEKLSRGVILAWAQDAALDSRIQTGLRQLVRAEDISDEIRLSIALKILHPDIPLVIRGNILTPGWLLDHPIEGYALITGPAPDFLRRIEADDWLSRLKTRAAMVLARARHLDIALNEEEIRVHLLSTSMVRLAALWEERRKLLPDTDHGGLASLIDRRQTAEEDLILLLGAAVGQFRSVTEVVEEAVGEASRAGITNFDTAAAGARLAYPRREIYRMVDQRIENFSRCGVTVVDDWADQYRLDRRISLARALALLALPEDSWKELPKQGYVSKLLDFFAKKISGGVLRGPLARMIIGKSSARIDLTELDSARSPATDMLQLLLARNPRNINIDPAVFAANDTLERRLRSLHAHALLYKRDTGIDGLYLGFPFLLMRDPRGNVRTRVAPVLLWPVRITPEVGNRGHVSIGFGRDHDDSYDPDQVFLNPAFEGLMGIDGARRWHEAANELLTRASISLADAMDAFGMLATSRGATLSPLPGPDVQVQVYQPELVGSAVLFHLTFMGQEIVKDLELLRGRPPTGTALETALRMGEREQTISPPPRARELDRFFTADSDPSQESAVLEARAAPGLVVEGPPGTGKSQTIVNMVADAIGRQKSLLVICQKQAALEVVRKRLEKEGLGDRIIMVTDVSRDREPTIRSVREQLDALHARPAGGAPAWRRDRERLAARIEALEGELDEYQAALHRVDERTGLTYRTLLGELITVKNGTPGPLDIPALRPQLAPLHPSEVAIIEEACAPLARHWLPAKFEGSALSALKRFSADHGTLELFLGSFNAFVDAEANRTRINLQTMDSFLITNPEPLRTWLLQHRSRFLSFSPAFCNTLARWIPLFRPRVGDSTGTRCLADLATLVATLQQLDVSAYASELSAKLRILRDEALERALTLATTATKIRSRIGQLNPLLWLQRRKLRKFLAANALATDQRSVMRFIGATRIELLLRPLRDRLNASLQTLFGQIAEPGLAPEKIAALATNLHAILSVARTQIASIEECPLADDLERAVLGGIETIEAFFKKIDRSLARVDAATSSSAFLEQLSAYFEKDWISGRRSTITVYGSNDAALAAIRAALPTLSAYQEFRIRGSHLGDRELAIFRALRPRDTELSDLTPSDLDQCVRRTISYAARIAWKLQLETSQPKLMLGSDEIAKKIEALAEADAGIRRCNRDLLVDGIDVSRIRPPREWEPITRLRGQRSRRLREFFDKAMEFGLLALRPVWLMTPDVASRVLLPKAGTFDTIVYDEASQMPVEYALPTLFRSKIVVVSGDDKQMPPTSFFSSKVENDEAALFDGEEPDDTATEEDRDSYFETWNRREIKDCPDLLHLARVALPTRTLQIHYRSAYRELIAFSNASFYGNRLSVPVRHSGEVVRRVRPIELIRSNGVYKNQTNPHEAADVVAYLKTLWEQPSPPSVGVVTFNRKQADVIDDALEEQAEEDRHFRDALMRERERSDNGEDMTFFVKNVENVQGDERDVIIFSSTFGPNAQGVFRRNFGVLGQTGGERRLNVAVTRARQKVVMITSMPIAEISDMLTTRRRPATPRDYLQAYLEYARMVSDGVDDFGRALLSRMVTERSPDQHQKLGELDGFVNSVEEVLRSRGWNVAPAQDGGAFSLDFAIEDPRTGLYAIGIECDAPRHRILETARAREVWRPRVLRQAVPCVHRVSSYGWMHAGDAECARLVAAVESALNTEGGR